MRTIVLAAAVAGSLAASGVGPAWAQSGPPPGQAPGPLLTPDANGSANLGNAASTPMHDMNIFRQRIPPVLLAAMADPYARPPRSCAALTARILEIDDAMGPDMDAVIPAGEKKTSGLPLLHALSGMLLPFSGAIRTISGAQKHDQQVVAAIFAGGIRRGYLKGLGEAHGCGPPATPRHFIHEPPPVIEEGRNRPIYPDR